jgi:opacity protein-like surface antigen
MNLKFIRSTFVASALFAGCMTSAFAADASKEIEAISKKMVGALENAKYDDFIADGDAGWKKVPKASFDSMANGIGPRLKAGYTLTYLGEIKQGGAQVTLWRIAFKTGDDLLAKVSIKDGKVTSFGLPRI